jgi:hypothetical protein
VDVPEITRKHVKETGGWKELEVARKSDQRINIRLERME